MPRTHVATTTNITASWSERYVARRAHPLASGQIDVKLAALDLSPGSLIAGVAVFIDMLLRAIAQPAVVVNFLELIAPKRITLLNPVGSVNVCTGHVTTYPSAAWRPSPGLLPVRHSVVQSPSFALARLLNGSSQSSHFFWITVDFISD